MKRKILIVEDEAPLAQMIGKMLVAMGYEVLAIVDNGEAALEAALQNDVDVVLLDVNIKGTMNGFQVAEEINRQKLVACIFATAVSKREIIKHLDTTKPYGYLIKPFQQNDIQYAIDVALIRLDFDRQKMENEGEFRALVEHNPIATAITTLHGDIRYINQPFCDLLNVTKEEAISLNSRSTYIDPSMREDVLKRLESVDTLKGVEMRIKRKGGAEIWLELNISKIRLKGEECLITGATDITERKKAYQSKEEKVQELEIINDVHQLLIKPLTLRETMQQFAELMVYRLGFKVVFFTEFDTKKELFTLAGIYPVNELVEKGLSLLGFSMNTAAIKFDSKNEAHVALRAGKEWLSGQFSDLSEGTVNKLAAQAVQKVFSAQKIINIPVMVETQLCGTIVIATESEEFSSNELSLIRTTASMVGSHIENSRLQMRLLDHRARLNAVFDADPNGIIVFDKNRHIIQLNSAAQNIFDISQDGLEAIPVDQWFALPDWWNILFQNNNITNTLFLNIGKLFNRELLVEAIGSTFFLDNNQFHLLILKDVTDRMRMEWNIRDSEHRMRSLVDNTFDMIQMVNPEGNLEYVNNAWSKTMQYSETEVIGKSLFQILHPESIEHCSILFQKILQGENIHDFEAKFLKKDGSVIEVEGNAVSYQIDSKITSTFTMLRDVTERNEKARQLAESENEYRTLVETQDELIVRFKPDTTITFVNEAHCRFYYERKEDVVGKRYIDRMDPLQRQGTLVHIQKIVESGSDTLEREYTIHGSKRWIRWHAKAIYNEHHEIIEIHSVGVDITHRTLSEQALRNEKIFSDVIINSLPGIFMLLTRDGRAVRWNRGAERITGYSTEELSTINGLAFIADQDKEATEKHFCAIFENGSSQAELLCRSKSGDTIPVYFTGYRMESPDGPMAIIIGMDITRQKRTELELQHTNARIEAMIENTSDFIWSIDHSYRLLGFNSNFSRYIESVLQLKLEPGQYILEINPEMTHFWKSYYDRALGGERFTMDFSYMEKDIEKSYEASFSPIIENNMISGAVIFSKDITQRKRSEALIRQTSANIRALIDNTQDSIWSVDREFFFTTINSKFRNDVYDAFGVWLEVGSRADDFLEVEQHQMWFDFYRRSLGGERFTAQFTYPVNQKKRTFEISFNPIFDQETITGVAVFSKDVTERLAVEKNIREREELLRQVIDLVPHFIFAKDIHGKFLLVNKAVADAYGTTVGELTGKSDADFAQSEEEVRHFREKDQEVIHSQEPVIIPEETITDAYGHERQLFTIKIPFRFLDSDTPAVLGVSTDITEQLHIKQRQSQILNTVPVILYSALTPSEHSVTWISENVERITGFKSTDFINKILFWESRLHPEDRDFVLKEFDRVSKGGSLQLEYRWQCADNDYRWFSDHIVCSPSKAKGKYFHSGVRQDITERKNAEMALKENESKLTKLFDLLPIGVSVINETNKIVYSNPALDRILRINPNQVRENEYQSRTYLRSDNTIMPTSEFASQRALDSRIPVYDVETGVAVNENEIIWTSVNAVPVDFYDWKLLITTTDISYRKNSENILRQQEEHLRLILESALDAVITIDDTGRVTRWNKQSEAVFGWSEDEMNGRRIADYILPKEHHEAHLQGLARYNSTGVGTILNRRIELTAKHRNGGIFPIELAIVPTKQGSSTHFTAFIRDITERKAAEERIKNQNRRLSVLNEVSKSLISSLNINELSLLFAKIMTEQLQYKLLIVNVMMDNGKYAKPVVLYPMSPLIEKALSILKFDTWEITVPFLPKTNDVHKLLAEGKDWVGEKMSALLGDRVPEFAADAAQILYGVKSIHNIPLYSKGRLYGTIVIASERSKITEEERNVNLAASQQLAGAFENAALFEATRDSEQKIAASERDYRGLFESALDAIVVFEPEEEIVLDVNQRATEIYGYTKDEFIGMSLTWISKDRLHGKTHIDKTLELGNYHNFVTQQYRKDGRLMDLEINASVVIYKGQKAILSINRDITEKRFFEAALEESESRYRQIIETTQEGVVTTDTNGIVQFANKQCERLLGIGQNQIVGSMFTSWMSTMHALQFQRMLTGGQIDIVLAGLDKKNIWVNCKISVLHNEANDVSGYLIMMTDITDQHRLKIEEARKTQNLIERQSTLLEISQMEKMSFEDGILLILSKLQSHLNVGRTVYWELSKDERVLTRYKSFPDDELGNRSVQINRIDYPDFFGGLLSTFSIVVEDVSNHPVTKDLNNILWLPQNVKSFLGIPIRSEGNVIGLLACKHTGPQNKVWATEDIDLIISVAGLLATFIEAHERNKTQDDLTRSRANLISLIENTQSAIWAIDEQYELLTANSIFNGFFLSQIKGPRPEETHPISGTEWKAYYDQAFHGLQIQVEKKFPVNGKDRLFELSFNPILSLDKVIGVSVFAQDVTERAELREKNSRMERLAALGQMSAVIAHEIRNPLGAVELNFEFLLRKSLIPETYRNVIGDSKMAFERIKNIINEILVYSNPKPILPSEANLHDAITQAVGFVQNEAQAKKINTIYHFRSLDPICRFDLNQMYQVFTNLFLNAIEFMSDGGTLTISTEDKPEALLLRIRDDGQGMDEQTLEHAFDPFYTTRTKGTGLGLAIVNQIIENHRFTISIESQKGIGTEFIITIPRD